MPKRLVLSRWAFILVGPYPAFVLHTDSDIAPLKNLGPRSVEMLGLIGIYAAEDLRRIGSVEAYRALMVAGVQTSLVMLYAMEGALLDCHWNDLPAGRKAELKQLVR